MSNKMHPDVEKMITKMWKATGQLCFDLKDNKLRDDEKYREARNILIQSSIKLFNLLPMTDEQFDIAMRDDKKWAEI